MTMGIKESLGIILLVAIVTLATRATPFLIFRDHDKTPKFIFYLGKVLPLAIMGMLIIYCLKGSSFTVYPYALPELISVAVVVLLHLWKRNNLISICGGTAVYMILVQFVFV